MKYNKSDHLIVENLEVRKNRNVKTGRFFCILNGKTYDTLYGLRNALIPIMSIKDYHDKYYTTEEDIKPCIVCNAKPRFFRNLYDGYREYCSSSCSNKTTDKRNKISNRFINNPEKLEEFRKKRKETIDNWTDVQKSEQKRKRYNTVCERYGSDFLSKKAELQWKNKTAEERKLISEKGNLTKKKNGTAQYNYYAQSNKRIEIKNKIYFCQGYEDLILQFLLEHMNFDHDEICVGKSVPRVKHECLSGVYHSDIFLPKLNLLIEVKSDYTLLKEAESGFKKQISSLKNNFNHVYFVPKPDKKRQLTEKDIMLFKNFINMTISSQARKEKVQRLSRDGEYTPIAIGSGSARALVNRA